MKLRLKEARKLKGLTLREAANGLKISHQTLDRLEKGCNIKKHPINSETIIRYAAFYEVTLDYLFSDETLQKIDLEIVHISMNSKF